MSVKQTAAHLIEGLDGRSRAYVQVQNGCDHRCTFCIIPFGRGNSRSVPMGEVVAQVRRLADNGYREVVLTGVDLTSYGAGLPGAPKLGTLVRQILRHVGGLARLRLSSLDCVEIDDELLEAFAEEQRLMPHLHLSLQAGDDIILKRMKRRHSRADAVALCERLRRLRPDMVFGADMIAGFPTETEAMFARSLDLVDDCGLTYLHVFPYLAAAGNAGGAHAAGRPRRRQGPRPARCAKRARRRCAAISTARSARARRVLTETADSGRSEHFTPVRFDAPAGARHRHRCRDDRP